MNYVTPPSVLVVEDESDLRQLVGDSLQAAGFEPVLVATAAEAMSRLDAFAFDALVVDLRLPDADGMDVLTAATDRYPGNSRRRGHRIRRCRRSGRRRSSTARSTS